MSFVAASLERDSLTEPDIFPSGPSVAKTPALYSAKRLCFLIGTAISSGFLHDAGTFLPIRLLCPSDCSDSILALVLVCPRPPDRQRLRKRLPIGGVSPTSPRSIHYLSRDRVVSGRKASRAWAMSMPMPSTTTIPAIAPSISRFLCDVIRPAILTP